MPVLLVVLLVLFALPLHADEVRLRNDDRFTGRVVSLAAGTLRFDTAHGELNIPWSDVAALSVDEPILATIGDAPPTAVTIAPADADRLELQPGAIVAMADITALARPGPVVTLDGGANAGFMSTSGNTDVNRLRLDGDVRLRQGDNRYTALAVVNRATDEGLRTAQNWTTSLNYDRFLTSRLFMNVNGILTHDELRDLTLRSAAGLGLGYQVLETTRVRLTANGGAGYVNENFQTAPTDQYTALRESAALDIFVVPNRIQLFHRHDGYFGVTGEDNLFVQTQNGVRLSLVAGFVTTAQLDLDYDRSPAPGRLRQDRTFALTFGYRF